MSTTVSKLVERAREAAKKKNYDYSVELYLEHLKLTPGDLESRKELRAVERERFKVNPPGMFEKAKIAAKIAAARAMPISKKDAEKSIISLEETLRSDPTAVSIIIKLGEAASYANLNEVAIQQLEDALTLDKANSDGLRLLGRVYKHIGTTGLDPAAKVKSLRDALSCFERLKKALPQDQEACNMCTGIPAQITSMAMQGTDGKVKGFTDLIDKGKAAELEKQSKRVRNAEDAKQRIEEELKNIAAKGGKADNKTWKLMADWSVMCKDFENALVFYDNALKEKPDDYLASEGKGDVKIKRYDDTIKKLSDALKKSPDDAIKAKLEKVKKEKLTFVVEEFSKRVEAHPTEYGLRLTLGKAQYELEQIDDAIKSLQAAKSSAAAKSEAGYYLGLCFGMKKKIYALAVKELEAAREDLVEMEGLKKDITYMLGRLHEAAKKNDKALAEFSAIAEVDYNFKDVTQRMEKLGQS